MLQFKATPNADFKMDCSLTGVPANVFVEVRFQNLSNGHTAVRVAESDSAGTAPIDFPGFTRDHAVEARILDKDPTVYRLIYPAEQPDDGGLLLTEPESAEKIAAPSSIFTPSKVSTPAVDEELK